MYAYSDTLILTGKAPRRPTIEEYELNAIKQFGVSLSKLKLSAAAKIRLHLDCDGRVEQIIFLEGSPTDTQMKELARFVGQQPFGIVPDYMKSGGLSDIVTDFTVSELEGIPTRNNMYISGGMEQLLALRLEEVGKPTVPPRPPAPAYTSAARAYDDKIGQIYNQLSAPSSINENDDDQLAMQIADLCASLDAKPAETDDLLIQLSVKIQACPLYGPKSPSGRILKLALKRLDDFCRQLMQRDLSEKRNNFARILELQKMTLELALKVNGYDSFALFKVCDLLEGSDMSLEASILYKHALNCLKQIDARRNELPQLEQKYADALTLAGKTAEASAVLADIKAMKDAELAEAKKRSKLSLEALLRNPKEEALKIIAARLDYSACLRREGNLQSAKEELLRAVADAEALPQRDAFVPWQLNLDRQVAALADLPLSSEEELLVCKIVSNLEAKLKGGFSYPNFIFRPNDNSDLKELVVKTIVKEKEKKFGPRSGQLESWLGLLAGYLETKHEYREEVALRRTILEIKENQARIMTVPLRIQLAIVQLKAGDIGGADRNYKAAVASLMNTSNDSDSFHFAHMALLQLAAAFIDAGDLPDADVCWRTAFKLQVSKEVDQQSLNKLLAAYAAVKKYDKAIALLDFLIDTIMQEPGHEAKSVVPRRLLIILALQASTDSNVNSRSAEFKTLSENRFAEFIRLCDTQGKSDKKFWETEKDEAIQERIDELRLLGRDSDAKKLEQEYDIR
jgi:tetratricopeptide (TPR) repeat protein